MGNGFTVSSYWQFSVAGRKVTLMRSLLAEAKLHREMGRWGDGEAGRW
ncbi:MAG: hypothetical protein F6K55_17615 [Moorea sp. SIO4A3]|nr:hypothetical protein [Moorena sp. SIO4A3]